MIESDSLQALRASNPRNGPDLDAALEELHALAARIVETDPLVAAPPARASRGQARRRRLVGVSVAGVAAVAAAVVAVSLAVDSRVAGSGTETAQAAVQRAADATAASAHASGTAVVRMTRGGEPWAGTTVRWHGDDVAIAREGRSPEVAGRPLRTAGDEMRVVGGTLYGLDENGDWIDMGSPDSIDPDSGTTPAETLAAVHGDVSGDTLARIADGAAGLAADPQADGSVVYTGTVAAGLVAPETGVKGGQRLRVLPFGLVANDAADANVPMELAVTVDDGVVRRLALAWGAGAARWTYIVAYDGLGATAAIAAPAGARSLLEERRKGAREQR